MKIATPEIRFIVVKAYQARIASRRQLADIFGYHIETIGRWIRKIRQEQPTSLPRGHRRSVFSAPELEQLAAYIESNPDATLNELREHFEKECSLPALHKIIRKLGYVFKKNSEGKRTRARRYSQEP
jgi:transposase